jgi:hypothetical protein
MANPYPGPRPFQADEYRIFAGRDHEVSELTSLIVAHQVVVLYAQSGAGKTSVVNAGVSPALGERGIRLLPVGRIGIPAAREIPLDDIANVYAYSAIGDLLPDIAADDPWRRRATLAEAFERLPASTDEFNEPEFRVFVLDQFEEIFSVYPQRWQDREKFFLQLAEALQVHRELRVLFVLREDFLAAFNEFTDLLPENGRTRYRLERLREAEALAAIKKPLECTSMSFDTDVAETMVRDLMAITVASPSGAVVIVEGEFVEPVQLQVVCFTLLERFPVANSVVTMEAYRKFGDPDEALESFYRKAVEATVSATGVDEAELRDWFESQLITSAGTRGLVFQDRERTGDIPNAVIEVLEGQHLIRPEVRSGARWYELTHDRFIRPIQKSNKHWKSAIWAQSFETYTEAIHLAVSRTGAAERDLRDFLDSLADSAEGRSARPLRPVPNEALNVLVEVGLLRRESIQGRQAYFCAHNAVARTILLANQSWRAATWSQSAALRGIESRADRWDKEESNKPALLLARGELRDADAVLASARTSGLGLSEQVVQFIEASRQAEWALKLRCVRWTALAFASLIAISLLSPATLQLRWQLLYYGMAGLGAAFTIARQKNDNDLIFRSLGRFLLLMLAGAASGMTLSLFPNSIPPVLGAPVAVFTGFFGTVLLLEVARSSDAGDSPRP